MKIQHIIAIVIIASIIGIAGFNFFEQQNSVNRWVDAQGGVHYNHPSNDYEIAVEFANDIVPVKEEDIPEPEGADYDVQGQTQYYNVNGGAFVIIIEEHDPAVVYHEAFHAQHNFDDPVNTEPNADAYAIEKGFYIHDGTY
jgi:hypothetical protein